MTVLLAVVDVAPDYLTNVRPDLQDDGGNIGSVENGRASLHPQLALKCVFQAQEETTRARSFAPALLLRLQPPASTGLLGKKRCSPLTEAGTETHPPLSRRCGPMWSHAPGLQNQKERLHMGQKTEAELLRESPAAFQPCGRNQILLTDGRTESMSLRGPLSSPGLRTCSTQEELLGLCKARPEKGN